MRIFITGAGGFIGTHLSKTFLAHGHEITGLVRSEKSASTLPRGVSPIIADSTKPGPWQNAVAGHDVLINLAGASIFDRRWTSEYKQLLRNSRILTTRNLADALPESEAPNMTLFNASAVGYYGFTEDEELDESAPPGNDFLARLAHDWEAEALRAQEKGARVVMARFGVVFGKNGGALEQMVRPFRFFVGGPLGNGRQWFSWIHVEDLCNAAVFVISRRDLSGSVNFTAPNPVRNADLTAAVGKVLRRPSFIPAPGFMIELLVGEFGSVILKGQRVVPHRLLSEGFSFSFPDVDSALRNCLLE